MRASARIALVALLAVVLFLAPPLTTDAAEGRRGPGRAVQGRKRPGQKATNADKLPMWVDRVVYPSSVDVPDVLKGLTSKDVKCGEGAQGEVSKFSHPDGFQAVVKFAFGTDAGLKVVGDEFATYQEVYNTAGTSQVPGLAEVFGTAYFNDPLKQAKRVLTLVMKGYAENGLQFNGGLQTLLKNKSIKKADLWNAVAYFSRQVLLALQALETAGYYSSDVAMRNVMLDTDGTPVVIDLGMAKKIEDGSSPFQET